MEITHVGHSSFKLRGKAATIITDPFDPAMAGIKFPQQNADCVTVSHQHKDHNYTAGILGAPVLVAGPGEYEVKGVRIIGIPTFHDDSQGSKRGRNTVYFMEMDSIGIVHCGDLGHQFDEHHKEIVTEPDILILPVGGTYTIDAREAAQMVSSLSPKIVIPMHYHNPKLSQEAFGALTPVDAFLKEIGKEGIVSQPKLTVTKDKLPQELTVVVLE